LPALVDRLKNSNKFEEIFGSLIALKAIVKNYQFLMDVDREPLEMMVPTIFPIFETLAKDFIEHYNE